MRESGRSVCVVTNDERVVLGRLRLPTLEAHPEASVEEVMAGHTTTRPDDPLEALTDRLRNAGARSILVTTPEGKLVGVLYRKDAERFLSDK